MAGTLTHTPAEVVRQLLVNLGVGTLPSANSSWPVYDSKEPDAPDDCVTVYNTTGVRHGRVHNSGEVSEHHGVQIRVRSATDRAGFARANAIDNALCTQAYREGVTVGAVTYCVHSLSRAGTVNNLGTMPESSRKVHTLNYLVHLRQE